MAPLAPGRTSIELIFLMFPVITLLYSTTISKTALNYFSEDKKYLSLHFLFPWLATIFLCAVRVIRIPDCCTAALIGALVFENVIIGRVNFSEEATIVISLALLVASQSQCTPLPLLPDLYHLAMIITTAEIVLLLPKSFCFWFFILGLFVGILHVVQSHFRLQFTFLEYLLILIWAGNTVEAIVKFQPQLTSLINFQCGEVLMVVNCGIICVSLILCVIALILEAFNPTYSQVVNPRRLIFLRSITFFILLIIGIMTVLLPSLKYFLSGQPSISWILKFLILDSFERLYLCLLWCCLIILFVISSQIIAFYSRLPKFCNRKIFHFLIILIIAPGIFIERIKSFTLLAIGVAFCAFLILETFRILVLVPSGKDWITLYYTLFEDENSEGRFWISSNMTLLYGCAFPLFLLAFWSEIPLCPLDEESIELSSKIAVGLCTSMDTTIWVELSEKKKLLMAVKSLLPHLGWITVGVGDSFAAIIGSQYGMHKWPGTKRTMEGTCAMFLSTLLTSIFILYSTVDRTSATFHDHIKQLFSFTSIVPIIVTLLLTSIMEAYTTENDNIILPLFSVVVYIAISSLFI